ncbi:MAG: di-trans,poly-cis-decaprenylcistransferase [Deltaproteobacteria bacterium RIFCSPLOWO2_12_FULL_43_16]|nr:MAG: di-trans,poly-cis-decaprenylcistransferase [Deltaproteobacteria bacterium GWA2_43_19]OGQ10668.1 MAG: di-trans,poly-cis-decaprenylcistransferase [Deltaproteobacteria bacterium RIFCSPHIGHO2_02_FULL_43_33]OGQ38629.1 MAG: di-trans,poly-cis-decaprenylcistransferase [Deltaproteobacteria bacterium RIFCSPLOWO2_01_FULL_42_9]OGQ58649.1 MAG: di-trans,poly-cis-decaprenylcistransferase [Deltaproteobacteria bacterium RIFCSPLOWO2_12_FULL_43_16]
MSSIHELIKERLPQHIAIIMDGNGRWAEKRFLGRINGHRKGIEVVKDIVEFCRELGIGYLTLYTFSKENWNRPVQEVNALMELLEQHLKNELLKLVKNGIRFKAIGNIGELPENIQNIIKEVEAKTKDNKGMVLNLALSYGGRAEIVEAAKKVALEARRGALDIADITEETFARYLYTDSIPDPDLLIRTSGEFRISNFLLWQLAYTEIYVTDVLWPDFNRQHLIEALLDFQNRERRFGLTGKQIKITV